MLRNLPIRSKLIAITLANTATVLAVTCVILFAYDYVSARRAAADAQRTLAEVVAGNSSAALAFANPDDARGVLAALSHKRDVVAAVLYDAAGRRFAHHPPALPGTAAPERIEPDAAPFTELRGDDLVTLAAVRGPAGPRLGWLLVRSDTQALAGRRRLYLAIGLAVLVAALPLAYLLARLMEGQVSRPILSLAATAREVAERGDYSVRPTRHGDDEVGLLSDAFGRMLGEIEEREQALLESEERLSLALRSSGMGTWTWDLADGAGPGGVDLASGTLACDERLLELFGIAAPAGIEACFAAIHPEDRPRIEAVLREAVESGVPYEVQFRVAGPGGEVRHLAGRGRVLRDPGGRPARMAGVTWDETPARLARDALRRSESRFRRLADSNVLGIIVADTEGRILEANDAFLAMVGRTRDELERGEVRWDRLTPPEWEEVDRELVRELSERGVTRSVEKEYQRPDGSRVPVQIGVAALDAPSVAGGPLECIAYVVDLTERKQAEERIARYAEELKRSNQQLEQFAYVASHDLQEPLRMVTSYTQLIERRYRDRLDDDGREFIQFAVSGVARMQALIRDLLEYSRVNTRGGTPGPVDLGQALAHARQNLAVALEEAGATLTADPLPVVQADAGQMVQLLQNLIANAVKFRGAEPCRVHVSAEPDRDGWTVSVADNGIGIDPGYFERIFVIFQRLHGPERYPGTGIGLAICKRIVERCGGRIWVESKPGGGSTFRFTLPREGSEPL